MALTPSYINNFNGGELSPLLDGRTDLKKYYSGCRTLKNFIVTPYGGVIRRPGLYYVGEVKDSSKQVRLIPFEYNIEQAYILEFGEEYIRFYKDEGQIIVNGGTEDLSASGANLDNVIAHYKLNEIGDTTTAEDSEGSHDGNISDSASDLHVTGLIGSGCFDFDGQYDVTISDHDDFSFTDDSDDNPFSIAAWIFVEDVKERQVILSKWKDGSYNSEWRLSLNEDRRLQLDLCDTGSSVDSLLFHYKCDDDAADTTVTDSQGNQNGTASTNTSDLSVVGKAGGNDAFEFDSASNEYVQLLTPTQAETHLGLEQSGGISGALWFYSALENTGETFAQLIDRDQDEYWSLNLNQSQADGSQTLRLELYNGTTLKANNLEIDTWYHAAFTIDYDTGKSKLYLDSILVDSNSDTGSSSGLDRGVTLAVDEENGPGVGNDHFDGKIDDVRIYDEAITKEIIEDVYNDGSGTEDTGIVYVWSTSGVLDLGWNSVFVLYSAPADSTDAANGIRFYVNNELSPGGSSHNDDNYTAMQNGSEEVRIGCQRNSDDTANEKYFRNKIDNVIITSDVLDSTEMTALYSEEALEIETPYSESDLFDIKFVQSADILYLVHPDYKPRKLSRFSHTSWDFGEIDFTWGPFRDNNTDTDLTIEPSATSGEGIKLTASSSLFKESHVGALFKLAHPKSDNSQQGIINASSGSEGDGTGYYTTITLKNTVRFRTTDDGDVDTEYRIQRKYEDDTNWHDFRVLKGGANYDLEWTEPDKDGAQYRIYVDSYGSVVEYTLSCEQNFDVGYVKITEVNNSTIAYGDVQEDFGATDATYHWAEGAWSDYRGWPRTLNFFENRLVFAGNTHQPLTLWFSETNNFEGMRSKTLAEEENFDDDALIFTISSAQQNMIKWIEVQDALLIGTAGAEGKLTSFNRAKPLTPTNIPSYRSQSTYGGSNLRSIVLNDIIMFVQRGNKKVREFKYDFDTDIFAAKDLTIFSEHITGDGLTDIAYQNSPNSIFWTTRSDGTLLGMTYERLEDIYGWFRVVTDGDIESVAVISSASETSSGTEDELWCVVEREINGSTVRYIEYMKPKDWASESIAPSDSGNLVSHWKLNDNDDDRIVDDSKGNNNGQLTTGTANNYVSELYNSAGKINGCLDFDGTNDYITVPSDDTLNFGDTTDFSLAAWVKIDAETNPHRIISKEVSGGGMYRLFVASSAGNEGKPVFDINDGTNGATIIGDSLILDDTWHHVAVTCDRDGNATMYVDGTAQADVEDISGVGDIDNTEDLYIAGHYNNSDYRWPGSIDDVRIYNDVLTQSEIDILYNEGNGTEAEQNFPTDLNAPDTNVFFVDSGLSTTDLDDSTYVSGLDHLENETVQILADGKVCDEQVVGTGNGGTAGCVDLKIDGTSVSANLAVHVGLPYTSDLQPMKLAVDLGTRGTSRGRMLRIHEAIISFENTLGGYFGRDSSNLDELDHAVTGTDGSMTPLKTTEETVSWPGLDDTYGNIFIRQAYPLPMTIRAIIPKLNISEI